MNRWNKEKFFGKLGLNDLEGKSRDTEVRQIEHTSKTEYVSPEGGSEQTLQKTPQACLAMSSIKFKIHV